LLLLDMKDQELEKLMRQIAADAGLDDTAADEIADSPTLWWSIQREIRNATPAKSPWPPNFLRKLLMIAVPAAAAVLIGLGVYVNSLRTTPPETAGDPHPQQILPVTPPASLTGDPEEQQPSPLKAAVDRNRKSTTKPVPAVQRRHAVSVPRTLTARNSQNSAAEIKSDFIALAYARSPESGQLVRMKVPSSMMVQLGLVSTVDKPSELVDAELLVGDDGLTHAIRFIRQ
jgi:hypothetical protein